MLSVFKQKVDMKPGDLIALTKVLDEQLAPIVGLDLRILTDDKSFTDDQAARLPVMLFGKIKDKVSSFCYAAVRIHHDHMRLTGEVPNVALSDRSWEKRTVGLLPDAEKLAMQLCCVTVRKQLDRYASKAARKVAETAAIAQAIVDGQDQEKAYSDGWKSFISGDAAKPPIKSGLRENAMWQDLAHTVLSLSKRTGEPLSAHLVDRVYPTHTLTTNQSILSTAAWEIEMGKRFASLAA